MALTRLPDELLEPIIIHVLPEGFESMAMTCRRIYALCIPYIQRHNTLKSRFHHFSYYLNHIKDPWPMVTAVELIQRIAVEPIVARYIQSANFKLDSPRGYIRRRLGGLTVDNDCSEDVIELFKHSRYLQQAGLNWKEFVDKIEEELDTKCPHYSQHASAFVLTLLPNVKELILPDYFKSNVAGDRLIDAIVSTAKQSDFLRDSPSMAKLIRFEPHAALSSRKGFDLGSAIPFLSLPHIRSFYGRSDVVTNDSRKRIKNADFGETLETVSFYASCLDEADIADFLKNTKRLKTLRYLHSTKENVGPQCWNICNFIEAIKRQVGSHLVELSISIEEPVGSIAPGKVSMRDFPCLRQLEFSLEFAMCNIAAVACEVTTPDKSSMGDSADHKLDSGMLLIGDIVPASVTVLSLTSQGKDRHTEALDVLFRDFAARKERTLPSLKELHIACSFNADAAYKDRCTRLLAETQKAGVDSILGFQETSGGLIWDGEQ